MPTQTKAARHQASRLLVRRTIIMQQPARHSIAAQKQCAPRAPVSPARTRLVHPPVVSCGRVPGWLIEKRTAVLNGTRVCLTPQICQSKNRYDSLIYRLLISSLPQARISPGSATPKAGPSSVCSTPTPPMTHVCYEASSASNQRSRKPGGASSCAVKRAIHAAAQPDSISVAGSASNAPASL